MEIVKINGSGVEALTDALVEGHEIIKDCDGTDGVIVILVDACVEPEIIAHAGLVENEIICALTKLVTRLGVLGGLDEDD